MVYGPDPAGQAAASSGTGIGPAVLDFLLTAPDSIMSLGMLAAAFLISMAWFALAGARRGRRLSLARLFARVLPARYLLQKSHLLDVWLFVLNTKVLGMAAVWLVVSSHQIGVWTNLALTGALGAPAETAFPLWAVVAITTIGLYLAYEFGYWLDHYLCHRIPWLWEFHRVHHEATTLSPLTVFRVHPVDSLFFANIMAVVTGPVQGLLAFSLGQSASEMTLLGYNAILLVGAFILVQLQHSHVWIPATGWLGRIILSPAHHQIHHSADPAHYGRNLGSCLAVFDWMFGTLIVPDARRQKLAYGVPDEAGADPHSLAHGLFSPFARIGASALRLIRRRRAAPQPGLPQAQTG
jgi:sterol desaturase/sphingolipid hydroxylase (fatty acid hydroxylase superfamily)